MFYNITRLQAECEILIHFTIQCIINYSMVTSVFYIFCFIYRKMISFGEKKKSLVALFNNSFWLIITVLDYTQRPMYALHRVHTKSHIINIRIHSAVQFIFKYIYI